MTARTEARKRILVLASTFPRWQGDSQPRFVLDLCRRLNQNYDITVMAPHCQNALRHEKLEGIDVVRFQYAPYCLESIAYDGGMMNRLRERPARALLLPFFFLAMLITALALVKKQNIKLLHAHWLVPQGIAAVLVKKFFFRRKIKLIVTSHGADLHSLKGRLWEIIKKWVVLNSDIITVVSNSMRKKILRFDPGSESRLHVAPMGTNLKTLFRPDIQTTKVEEPFIVFVGRLVEKKGVRYLLQALVEVREFFPKTKLCIIGDGPLRQELEDLTNKLKLKEVVQFVGAVQQSNLPDYYRSAHISVFPFVEAKDGDQEGLGLVVLEAMGCGSPVVATNIGALEDTILNNKAAKLCQQKSSHSLSDAIIEILKEDETNLRLFTKVNRDFAVKKFDWGETGDKYIMLFDSLSKE